MARLIPKERGWSWNSLAFIPIAILGAAVVLNPMTARAQQSASHAGSAPRHPMVAVGTGVHPAPTASVPVRRPAPNVPRLASGVRPRIAGRFLYAARAASVETTGVFPVIASSEWVVGAPNLIRPFFFGAFFPGGFGYPGSISQWGGLPLGFGLWPACDAGGTQGVFWTVGPCFASGTTYAEQVPNTGQAPLYVRPLILFEMPERARSNAEQASSAPSVPATMLLYLTDGRAIPASDWWVEKGRLQYVTDAGVKGVLDLPQLDLEQTIKENQKHGLEFHLKFTPPSERP